MEAVLSQHLAGPCSTMRVGSARPRHKPFNGVRITPRLCNRATVRVARQQNVVVASGHGVIAPYVAVKDALSEKCINAIRFLAIDGVDAANSG